MKKIAITGATSGIGLEIKKQLSAKGDEVFNLSRRNDFDLSTIDGQRKTVEFIKNESIDILFLNSGLLMNGLIGSYKYGDVEKIFNLNFNANVSIINQLWDLIKKNELKVIVTLSTAAHINGASESIYSTSKKALKEFVIAANTELIYLGQNNQIFMFSPPFVRGTKMTSEVNQPSEELTSLVYELLESINRGENFFVPNYEKIYKRVFKEYKDNPIKQGLDSIEYRKSKGRWGY